MSAPTFTPTRAHFVLWAYRNRPKWAQGMTLPVANASVDAIVNARAGIKSDRHQENALSLLYLVRDNSKHSRNPSVGQYMRDFPHKSVGPDRGRAVRYARWVRALDRAALKRRGQGLV